MPVLDVTLPAHMEGWPRVTEIIGATLGKPELVDWAYRQTVESITGALHQTFNSGQLYQMGESIWETLTDYDELDAWLKENRLRPTDVADELADRGIAGHDYLEYLARMYIVTGEEEMVYNRALKDANDPELPPHTRAIADWWTKREPAPIASERPIWSKRHQYRGTLDLYWRDTSGDLVITDLKNRKENRPCGVKHKTPGAAAACHETTAYRSDHVQTGGYQVAMQELGFKVDRRTVLVARADGTWGEYSTAIKPETFLTLLTLHRQLRGD